MRTHIRSEWVRFGTVQHMGRKSVMVELEPLGGGKKMERRRFYLSHFRRAETLHGKVVFATGPTREVCEGDSVVCVPQDDGYGLWAHRGGYEYALTGGGVVLGRAAPLGCQSPTMAEVRLDPEMERRLGERQMQSFYRRFPPRAPTVV